METENPPDIKTTFAKNKAAPGSRQQNGEVIPVYGTSQSHTTDQQPTKSPLRKPTPANPHRVDHFYPTQKLNNSTIPQIVAENSNENDSEDEDNPIVMSSATQDAHSLSLFLSTSSSDENEPNSETVIAAVYRDPLDQCMDRIEELAAGILRTSRLTINGEPGDMSKVHPALFGLQATEKQIPSLLHQLMQYPFFNKPDKGNNVYTECWKEIDDMGDSDYCSVDYLTKGHVRLGIPIDMAIYTLLRSHSAKGAKQAEALINVAMNYNYLPSHSFIVMPGIPPIIFRSTSYRKKSQVKQNHITNSDNSETTQPSLSPKWQNRRTVTQQSGSSISEKSERSISGLSMNSSYSSTSSSSLYNISEDNDASQQQKEVSLSPVSGFKRRVRKDSKVLQRPISSGSDISLDEESISDRKLIPDNKHWNTSIMDNSVIVSQYGQTEYPLLSWDPRLKVDFRLSSSIGNIAGMVTGIDSNNSTVTMRVNNTSGKTIGIAIRVYRQTTVYKPIVLFPSEGLHVIQPDESNRSWEDNVEFYPGDSEKHESFVMDLFVCTLDENPSWNIQRKYAVMKGCKGQKNLSLSVKRRRPSHFHMPGTKEQKAESMKLVISHGLQCVVKRKLPEAEVILSQALHLPDFQRVPLKAFLYICLAVVAEKRKKQGQVATLMPAIMANNAAHTLIEICESTPGPIKMPKSVMLVKQLMKELNIKKIMKEEHNKKLERVPSIPTVCDEKEKSNDIQIEGGKVVYKNTELTVPAEALRNPTQITLSTTDCQQLDTLLKSRGWNKVVCINAAIKVQCSPFLERFEKPVNITTVVENGISLSSHSMVRLLQSKYLRHWQDITDDLKTIVQFSGNNQLQITTDQTGWLAVATVQYDVSMIAQLALRALCTEPIMLQLSTFGFVHMDSTSMQVAVFVVPCNSDSEPMETVSVPEPHKPIAFPHVIQVYPGERLRLKFHGQFEPDTEMGENSLEIEFEVPKSHTRIFEKWIKISSTPHVMSSPTSSSLPSPTSCHPGGEGMNKKMLNGKLIVCSCRKSFEWDSIAEINLSTRTDYTRHSTSSSSEHSSH